MLDEHVEAVCRAVYALRPMRAISPALAGLCGVEIGQPISWDAVIAAGGNHDGLVLIVRDTIRVMLEMETR